MKNFMFTLIFLFTLSGFVQAQTMYIHKNGGEVVSVPLNNIEKITFTGEGTNTISDIDGNVYNIVQIGSQLWMADNLKTTKYHDGSSIPLQTNDASWTASGHNNSPAYCWYGNNISNKNPYGALYNFYALDPETNGGKHVCPAGWRVPTDEDWTKLTNHLGGLSVAGGKMKATGTEYWQAPNSGATNESGFNGLPGGSRSNADFIEMGKLGRWWSSTVRDDNSIWFRQLSNGSTSVLRHNLSKYQGFSIRCIKE